MPEENDETLSGITEINYPDGFNSENCVVVSLMSHNSFHTDYWSTTLTSNSPSSMLLGNADLMVTLKPEKIRILSNKNGVGQSRRDVTFKLVLMKLPELVQENDYKLGDINGDGSINQTDLDLLGKFLTGEAALTDRQIKAADVNKDGVLDTGDTLKLAQYVNGQISSFN